MCLEKHVKHKRDSRYGGPQPKKRTTAGLTLVYQYFPVITGGGCQMEVAPCKLLLNLVGLEANPNLVGIQLDR